MQIYKKTEAASEKIRYGPINSLSQVRLLGCRRQHGYEGLVLPGLAECNHSVHEGVQSMVRAHAYVLAGIVDCASLTDEDVAGLGHLAAEQFQSKSFAV